MAKVHIKIKTDKRNCRKMINHRLLFLFRWKYMRENPFNLYICNKRVEVESVLHLFFHMQFSCILNPSRRRRMAEFLTIFDSL